MAFRQHNIVVKKSNIHGLGVFAGEDIAKNEVIEECPVLLDSTPGQIIFEDYFFILRGNTTQGLPLGYGALYNHSDEPNADYLFCEEQAKMQYVAVKPIKAGEEIFIYYGDNWFASRKAKPLQSSMRYRIKKFIRRNMFVVRFALVTSLVYGSVLLIRNFSV